MIGGGYEKVRQRDVHKTRDQCGTKHKQHSEPRWPGCLWILGNKWGHSSCTFSCTVAKMAEAVAEGCRCGGTDVVLRRVPELMSEEVWALVICLVHCWY